MFRVLDAIKLSRAKVEETVVNKEASDKYAFYEIELE